MRVHENTACNTSQSRSFFLVSPYCHHTAILNTVAETQNHCRYFLTYSYFQLDFQDHRGLIFFLLASLKTILAHTPWHGKISKLDDNPCLFLYVKNYDKERATCREPEEQENFPEQQEKRNRHYHCYNYCFTRALLHSRLLVLSAHSLPY